MLLALPMRWVRRWGWASPVVPLRPSTAAVGAAVGGAGFGGQGTALRAGRDCAALRSVGRCGGRALTGAKPLGAPRLRCGTGRDSVPLRFATLHYARPALACRRAPSPPLRPTALLPPSLRLLAPPDPPLAPPRLRPPTPSLATSLAGPGLRSHRAVATHRRWERTIVPRLDVVLPSPPPAACRPAPAALKPRTATD